MRWDEYCAGLVTAACLITIGAIAQSRADLIPAAAPLAIAPPDAIKDEHYRGLPPIQLQGARTVTVRFLEGEAINRECGHLKEERAMACTNGNTIIAENPCSYVARNGRDLGLLESDYSLLVYPNSSTNYFKWRGGYGRFVYDEGSRWGNVSKLWDYTTMLCHELGHANGWPADHWHTKELP